MNRLWWRLTWRLRPPCGAPPPWRLVDAGPCIVRRGHERLEVDSTHWHADGAGFIWSDVEGRWRWMGPVVDLGDSEYHEPPGGSFVEEPPTERNHP